MVFGVISGCLSSPEVEKTMTFTVDSRKIVVDEMGNINIEEPTKGQLLSEVQVSLTQEKLML